MELLKKIIRKIQEGALHEVLKELHWIYQYGLKYKGSILWYIFLGIFRSLKIGLKSLQLKDISRQKQALGALS